MKYWTILFACFWGFSLFGQSPFSVEPMAGVSLTRLQPSGELSDILVTPSNRINVSYGLRINYDLSPKVFLSGGVHYLRKGSDYSDVTVPDEFLSILTGGFGLGNININDFVDATAQVQINYLNAPVTVGYRLKANDKLSFFAETGGYFSYGLSGKTGGALTSEFPLLSSFLDPDEQAGEGEISFDNDFSRIDFGWLAGGGIAWYGFTLSFQYGLGLHNTVGNFNDAFFGTVPQEAQDVFEQIDVESRTFNRFFVGRLGYRITF